MLKCNMMCHPRRHLAVRVGFTIFCVLVAGNHARSIPRTDQPSVPALPAQEVFKRVSPSVVVVESIDVSGSGIAFGSGVVIAPGHVVTNRHVIEGGASFAVGQGGKKWPAKLVGVDSDHDLAELSIAGLAAPAVKIRTSSTLSVGETVYAVGAPEHLELTISEGLISGLRDFDKDRFIQTSAAISRGSSGGGLFDAEARLVGITTFYLEEGQSLNFALPAEWALRLENHPDLAETDLQNPGGKMRCIVWFEIGYNEGAAGKYTRAIDAFRNAIHCKPNFPEAHYNLAQMMLNNGNRDGALAELLETLRESPDDMDALKTSALLLLGRHDYEGAAKAYRKLIELQPDASFFHTALGLVLEDQGSLKLALAEYRVALALDPSDKSTRELYNALLKKTEEQPTER